ncbi:MAG: transporter, partial [Alteromonas sp.]
FFEDVETPVIADFEQDDYDRQQRNKLGVMVIIMSAGMLVMMLIPNPLWGRLMFLGCAVIMLAIGLLLKHSAKKEPTTATSSLSKKPCLE